MMTVARVAMMARRPMPSFSGYAVAHGCALAARRTARVCASSDSNDGHLMARYVVDEHVVDGTTISLGSGRLIGLIVKYLAEKVSEGELKSRALDGHAMWS